MRPRPAKRKKEEKGDKIPSSLLDDRADLGFAAYLAALPASVARTARALQRLIGKLAPDARVAWRPGWRALTYANDRAGYFCGLFPMADKVRLYFERGVGLADPAGILTGSTRQTRQIDFQEPADIEALRPALDRVLQEAADFDRKGRLRSRQRLRTSL